MNGIVDSLSPLFWKGNNCASPHTVIELSCTEYNAMKDNSIHVEGAALGTCDGNDVQWYSKFKCGPNIITGKVKRSGMPNNGCLKDVKLGEMKGKYFIITCDKKEFNCDTSIFIISSQWCDCNKYNREMSGKLLLMYCVDDHQKNCTGWEWNASIWNAMKGSKNNIITKKNNHNGSSGHYYSYGNRCNFGVVDGSSVGQYTYKCFKNDLKTTSSHIRDTAVQHISSHELGAGIDSLASRLPNIKHLISPIVNAAYATQTFKGNIGLEKVESTNHGVWQSSVCVLMHIPKIFIKRVIVQAQSLLFQSSQKSKIIRMYIGLYFNYRNI